MPLYDYKCKICANVFEVLVKSGDRDKEQACPKCESKEVGKLVSRTSFSLKGGGWASDGYSK
jgi:hypothetical protein